MRVQLNRLVELMEPEAAVGYAGRLQQLLDYKNSLITDADLSLDFFDDLATYAARGMVRHVLHNSTREPTPCGPMHYTQEERRKIGLLVEHCTGATPCNECKSAIMISKKNANTKPSNMETLQPLVSHLAVLPLVCHEGQRLMHDLKGRTKGAICSEAYRGIAKESGARNRQRAAAAEQLAVEAGGCALCGTRHRRLQGPRGLVHAFGARAGFTRSKFCAGSAPILSTGQCAVAAT